MALRAHASARDPGCGHGSSDADGDRICCGGFRKMVSRVFVRDIGDPFCIWRTDFSGRAEYWRQSSNAVGGIMGADKYRCVPAVDRSADGENVVAGGLATCSVVGSVADQIVEIIRSTPGCITATGLGGLNASNGSEE